MNSNDLTDLFVNSNNKEFSELQKQIQNYKNPAPSISNPIQNQQNQEKVQYLPITTKESFTSTKTIYLVAEDNNNLNKNMTKYENNNDDKSKNKHSKNNKAILIPQRSIEFHFQNKIFEYLLNSQVKNDKEENVTTDNNINYKGSDNNKNNLYNNTNNSIKKEKSEEDNNNSNNNSNSKNPKDNFVSTIKNIFNQNRKSRNKGLVKSYSVDNCPESLLN